MCHRTRNPPEQAYIKHAGTESVSATRVKGKSIIISGPTKGIMSSNSAFVPLKQVMGLRALAAIHAQPLNCEMATINKNFLST